MREDVIAMRDAFFEELYNIAKRDKRVIFVAADCGAPSLDKFRKNLKGQYFTVGIAEQNMISVAAGLALEGKIVYTYAIAPFASLRCYEQIKVDLCCMELPVNILGVGAGLAYDIMGPTHHSTEDISIMRALPHMTILNPSDSVLAADCAKFAYAAAGPKYIRFDRGNIPLLYKDKTIDINKGLIELKPGRDMVILATGIMVHRALEVANVLSEHSVNAGIVDVFRIKPINDKALLKIMREHKNVLTLEEHSVIGGLGSAVLEALCDNEENHVRLKRIGICDRYYFEYGGRERLHELCGLDADNVASAVLNWMNKERPALVKTR